MTDDKKQNKGDFKTLSSADALVLDNMNYYVSVQEIKQDNGNTSEHCVIKKQNFNEDGSPRGQSRQLFIKREHITKVLKHANDFLLSLK